MGRNLHGDLQPWQEIRIFNYIYLCKNQEIMADVEGFDRLSNDLEGNIRDISYENGLIDYDTHFSDPEEFVDGVSDDGL